MVQHRGAVRAVHRDLPLTARVAALPAPPAMPPCRAASPTWTAPWLASTCGCATLPSASSRGSATTTRRWAAGRVRAAASALMARRQTHVDGMGSSAPLCRADSIAGAALTQNSDSSPHTSTCPSLPSFASAAAHPGLCAGAPDPRHCGHLLAHHGLGAGVGTPHADHRGPRRQRAGVQHLGLKGWPSLGSQGIRQA